MYQRDTNPKHKLFGRKTSILTLCVQVLMSPLTLRIGRSVQWLVPEFMKNVFVLVTDIKTKSDLKNWL